MSLPPGVLHCPDGLGARGGARRADGPLFSPGGPECRVVEGGEGRHLTGTRYCQSRTAASGLQITQLIRSIRQYLHHTSPALQRLPCVRPASRAPPPRRAAAAARVSSVLVLVLLVAP